MSEPLVAAITLQDNNRHKHQILQNLGSSETFYLSSRCTTSHPRSWYDFIVLQFL